MWVVLGRTILLLLAALALAGCGGGDEEAANSETGTTMTNTASVTTDEETTAEEPKTGATSACREAATNVENYDILAPGASRKEYLVLLHTLQRDCPQVANARGLAADYLPRCKRLDQENCTMYRG
jgi:hypothetical protein